MPQVQQLPQTGTSPATTRTAWLYGEQQTGTENNIFPWDRAEGLSVDAVPTNNGLGRVVATARRVDPVRAADGTLTDGTSADAKWRITTRSYDAKGRIASTNIAAPDLGRTQLQYTYDRQGQLTKRQADFWWSQDAFTQWYTYTPRGQVEAVYAAPGTNKPSVPEVTYTYTADGQVDETVYRNGIDETYAYDVRGRLTDVSATGSSGDVFAQQYDYRLNSQIDRAETYSDVTAPGATGRFHYAYDYDALGRLTGADYFEGGFGNPTGTSAYDVGGLGYDRNGNLTALQRRDDSGKLVDDLSYSYSGGINRLSGLDDAAGSVYDWDAGSGGFTYDASGRLTSATAAPYAADTLIYNDQDLPVRIGLPEGEEITYRYSAEGQRTYTQVGTSPATFTVRDGAAALGQFSHGPAIGGGTTPSVDYYNVLLPSGTPIGRFVGGAESERRYYHTDHLGSTRAVTDPSGQVVERRDHYPFGLQMPGRTLAQGPRADEDYTGHELDDETGMHYAGARFYMSALGRWGTTDPLADDFPAWSSYNYVQNNPLRLVDPDGRAPMDWYRDQDDSVRFDPEVQSQDDLDEGQEYLGERLLARSEDGGAQLLEPDGSARTVFEGRPSSGEVASDIMAGFAGATSKAQWTLEMAGDAGKTLAKRNSVVATGLTVAGITSGTVGRESDSILYQTLMGGTELGILGVGFLGGPKGAIGAAAFDIFGKDPVVEWATTSIYSLQVDRTIDVERPVNEEEARR